MCTGNRAFRVAFSVDGYLSQRDFVKRAPFNVNSFQLTKNLTSNLEMKKKERASSHCHASR